MSVGYELAYKLAGEQLAKIGDIEQQCLKSGARYLEVDSKKGNHHSISKPIVPDYCARN